MTALLYGVTGDNAASVGPTTSPALGEAVTVRLWGQQAFGPSAGAPPLNAMAEWTPVLVLTHDCEMDKELNEHVDQYLRDHPGVAKEDVPYEDAVVPAARHEGIRQAQKIGSVPAMPAYGDDAFFVLLNRETTVGRELLATHYKVASLSKTARPLLRFTLAEALASRHVAPVSALEAALGE